MPHLSKKQHQILETKHRLSKALYLLVTERHYDKITIYHILEKADISRRTFYRHFSSKADLMDYCLDNFVEGYYLQRDHFISAERAEDVFLVTLNFMYYNRDFICSLVESGHFSLLTAKFNDKSELIYKTIDLPWCVEDSSDHSIDYISKGLFGAYLNVLQFWLIKDKPEPPKYIAKNLALLFSSIPSYFDNISQKSNKDN
ncbi:TetR/AcrR family transcriptional regulator [Streptococcus gallolyticus]|uniref:TetR/AcrR family transcriptional regulator n=1 Tax=Streptococcus gallolyticus TaxID=315405 RepID=UPI0008895074|nr:TetR/AcrR family transcriptional regulator [Streptococcus gallolyticus]SDK24173.1 transcriptional regulator, TetR family [Streptococcus gallolyticus]SDL71891.1 transcriptional regulator, TetR family [Streptococcus gallolyticus]